MEQLDPCRSGDYRPNYVYNYGGQQKIRGDEASAALQEQKHRNSFGGGTAFNALKPTSLSRDL